MACIAEALRCKSDSARPEGVALCASLRQTEARQGMVHGVDRPTRGRLGIMPHPRARLGRRQGVHGLTGVAPGDMLRRRRLNADVIGDTDSIGGQLAAGRIQE